MTTDKNKRAITVVGSFVVGMTVKLPRLPVIGETLEGDLFHKGVGGKGSNVAVAIQRLGGDVTLIERVGDDEFARMAFDLYASEGISSQYVYATPGQATGVGLVYLGPEGENTIGLYKGANLSLAAEDIDAARSTIASSAVMTLQLEVSDSAVSRAVSLAKEYGIQVILNPAPAKALAPEVLEAVDVLTPNTQEAMFLLGMDAGESLSVDDVKDMAKELVRRGPRTVVITMGSTGAVYATEGESIFQPSVFVKAQDSVGAGDAFNAGLAVALAEGKEIMKAVRFASVCGALAATEVGILESLPVREQADTMYHSQNW